MRKKKKARKTYIKSFAQNNFKELTGFSELSGFREFKNMLS